ncbi:macrophage scavenger receptor types I and II-like [Antedon mediterranea]|uniref:macrophage scavenger receptor types I and II-like n=1 Tax=Antedon mediterranea TaxID=105859 RepID=UPI003AF59728
MTIYVQRGECSARYHIAILLVLLTVGSNVAYDIRLVNGNSKHEGRVEILVDGSWGTICDTNWWVAESDAVCKKLGYEHGSHTYKGAHFGEGPDQILFYSVNCSKGMDFDDCHFEPTSIQPCSHHRDVGVKCNTGEDDDGSGNNKMLVGVIVIVLLVIVCLIFGIHIIRNRRRARNEHAHRRIKSEEEEQQTKPINEKELIENEAQKPEETETKDV